MPAGRLRSRHFTLQLLSCHPNSFRQRGGPGREPLAEQAVSAPALPVGVRMREGQAEGPPGLLSGPFSPGALSHGWLSLSCEAIANTMAHVAG